MRLPGRSAVSVQRLGERLRQFLKAAGWSTWEAEILQAVQAHRDERIAFLLVDYAHLFDEPNTFKAQLRKLIGLHSRERVERWCRLIDEDERATLFGELIELHYDPAYTRSSSGHFVELPRATPFILRPNDADIDEQARALLDQLQLPR